MLTVGACGKGKGGHAPISIPCFLLCSLSVCLPLSSFCLPVCLSSLYASPVLAWPGALVSALVPGGLHGLLSPAGPCCLISLSHLSLGEELRVPRSGEPWLTEESRRAGEGW